MYNNDAEPEERLVQEGLLASDQMIIVRVRHGTLHGFIHVLRMRAPSPTMYSDGKGMVHPVVEVVHMCMLPAASTTITTIAPMGR
jgi:hypothetical protein